MSTIEKKELHSEEEMKEKSVKLAGVLEGIKVWFPLFDIAHAKEMISQMRDQASRQDTMAALSVRYNPVKSDILRLQAKMLQSIVDTIETGIKINELKEKVKVMDDQQASIEKLFF